MDRRWSLGWDGLEHGADDLAQRGPLVLEKVLAYLLEIQRLSWNKVSRWIILALQAAGEPHLKTSQGEHPDVN